VRAPSLHGGMRLVRVQHRVPFFNERENMNFKQLNPIDRNDVVYFVNVDEISFMSRFEAPKSIIIDATGKKTHTLIQLKNGQSIVVLQTPTEILSKE
jgi:hypothetical protein